MQNEVPIAFNGIVVRVSTRLNFVQYGRPRSLAKDHIILEEAANDPTLEQNCSTATSVSMMIAAVVDCVARAKISIAGNWSFDMESTLTSQNSKASSIPDASAPLMMTLAIIERGTLMGAF